MEDKHTQRAADGGTHEQGASSLACLYLSIIKDFKNKNKIQQQMATNAVLEQWMDVFDRVSYSVWASS